jgi:hypothetical protein
MMQCMTDGVLAYEQEEAKKMKNMRQYDRLDVGRIMVGQNEETATRY